MADKETIVPRVEKLTPDQKRKLVKERHRQVARAVVQEGKSLSQALREAKYSERQITKKGAALLTHTPGLLKAFQAESKKLKAHVEGMAALGKTMSSKELELYTRARLVELSQTGEKVKGQVRATELVGKLKDVSAFEKDFQVGVNIMTLEVPEKFRERFAAAASQPPVIEVIEGREYIVTPPADMIHAPLGDGLPQKREAAPRKSFEDDIKELEVKSSLEEK